MIAAIAHPATESWVFPTSPLLPPEWQGMPCTSTYTRSAWDVTLSGTALAEKTFRLAFKGTKLVPKKSKVAYSGALTAG